MRRAGLQLFDVYVRMLWLAMAGAGIVSEIIPAPHVGAVWFYGLYLPAKLVSFLSLGFLTPLAFAQMNAVNRGIAFATSSAVVIEILQSVIGNGHRFHLYELLVKVLIIICGFSFGLSVRF